MQQFETINLLSDDKRKLARRAMDEDEFMYETLHKAILKYCSEPQAPVDPDGDQFEGA